MSTANLNPLVSILLPTYNGATRISRAIDSVLAQTYQNWELLILDDGSTDATHAAVNSFSDPRIRYIKNDTNLGIQKTLNRGLQEVKGKYIARIDDDDVWVDREKLEKQVMYLDTHPEHVLVGTGVIIVDEKGKELIRYLVPQSDEAVRHKLLGKNCFVHSTVMFTKDSALGVGGYDETTQTRHLEDYDLWLKLGTVGQVANLPFYTTVFMLRAEGLSSQNKMGQARKAFSIAKKYKKQYPGYMFALIRSGVRLLVYGIILRFPIQMFVNRLAKWYKEKW